LVWPEDAKPARVVLTSFRNFQALSVWHTVELPASNCGALASFDVWLLFSLTRYQRANGRSMKGDDNLE
jgi:hypothetical protein